MFLPFFQFIIYSNCFSFYIFGLLYAEKPFYSVKPCVTLFYFCTDVQKMFSSVNEYNLSEKQLSRLPKHDSMVFKCKWSGHKENQVSRLHLTGNIVFWLYLLLILLLLQFSLWFFSFLLFWFLCGLHAYFIKEI